MSIYQELVRWSLPEGIFIENKFCLTPEYNALPNNELFATPLEKTTTINELTKLSFYKALSKESNNQILLQISTQTKALNETHKKQIAGRERTIATTKSNIEYRSRPYLSSWPDALWNIHSKVVKSDIDHRPVCLRTKPKIWDDFTRNKMSNLALLDMKQQLPNHVEQTATAFVEFIQSIKNITVGEKNPIKATIEQLTQLYGPEIANCVQAARDGKPVAYPVGEQYGINLTLDFGQKTTGEIVREWVVEKFKDWMNNAWIDIKNDPVKFVMDCTAVVWATIITGLSLPEGWVLAPAAVFTASHKAISGALYGTRSAIEWKSFDEWALEWIGRKSSENGAVRDIAENTKNIGVDYLQTCFLFGPLWKVAGAAEKVFAEKTGSIIANTAIREGVAKGPWFIAEAGSFTLTSPIVDASKQALNSNWSNKSFSEILKEWYDARNLGTSLTHNVAFIGAMKSWHYPQAMLMKTLIKNVPALQTLYQSKYSWYDKTIESWIDEYTARFANIFEKLGDHVSLDEWWIVIKDTIPSDKWEALKKELAELWRIQDNVVVALEWKAKLTQAIASHMSSTKELEAFMKKNMKNSSHLPPELTIIDPVLQAEYQRLVTKVQAEAETYLSKSNVEDVNYVDVTSERSSNNPNLTGNPDTQTMSETPFSKAEKNLKRVLGEARTPAQVEILITEQQETTYTRAKKVLARELTGDEKIIIRQAHLIGFGELGNDGMRTIWFGYDHYTEAQIAQIARHLATCRSISEKERRSLIEKWVCGRFEAPNNPYNALTESLQKETYDAFYGFIASVRSTNRETTVLGDNQKGLGRLLNALEGQIKANPVFLEQYNRSNGIEKDAMMTTMLQQTVRETTINITRGDETNPANHRPITLGSLVDMNGGLRDIRREFSANNAPTTAAHIESAGTRHTTIDGIILPPGTREATWPGEEQTRERLEWVNQDKEKIILDMLIRRGFSPEQIATCSGTLMTSRWWDSYVVISIPALHGAAECKLFVSNIYGQGIYALRVRGDLPQLTNFTKQQLQTEIGASRLIAGTDRPDLLASKIENFIFGSRTEGDWVVVAPVDPNRPVEDREVVDVENENENLEEDVVGENTPEIIEPEMSPQTKLEKVNYYLSLLDHSIVIGKDKDGKEVRQTLQEALSNWWKQYNARINAYNATEVWIENPIINGFNSFLSVFCQWGRKITVDGKTHRISVFFTNWTVAKLIIKKFKQKNTNNGVLTENLTWLTDDEIVECVKQSVFEKALKHYNMLETEVIVWKNLQTLRNALSNSEAQYKKRIEAYNATEVWKEKSMTNDFKTFISSFCQWGEKIIVDGKTNFISAFFTNWPVALAIVEKFKKENINLDGSWKENPRLLTNDEVVECVKRSNEIIKQNPLKTAIRYYNVLETEIIVWWKKQILQNALFNSEAQYKKRLEAYNVTDVWKEKSIANYFSTFLLSFCQWGEKITVDGRTNLISKFLTNWTVALAIIKKFKQKNTNDGVLIENLTLLTDDEVVECIKKSKGIPETNPSSSETSTISTTELIGEIHNLSALPERWTVPANIVEAGLAINNSADTKLLVNTLIEKFFKGKINLNDENQAEIRRIHSIQPWDVITDRNNQKQTVTAKKANFIKSEQLILHFEKIITDPVVREQFVRALLEFGVCGYKERIVYFIKDLINKPWKEDKKPSPSPQDQMTELPQNINDMSKFREVAFPTPAHLTAFIESVKSLNYTDVKFISRDIFEKDHKYNSLQQTGTDNHGPLYTLTLPENLTIGEMFGIMVQLNKKFATVDPVKTQEFVNKLQTLLATTLTEKLTITEIRVLLRDNHIDLEWTKTDLYGKLKDKIQEQAGKETPNTENPLTAEELWQEFDLAFFRDGEKCLREWLAIMVKSEQDALIKYCEENGFTKKEQKKWFLFIEGKKVLTSYTSDVYIKWDEIIDIKNKDLETKMKLLRDKAGIDSYKTRLQELEKGTDERKKLALESCRQLNKVVYDSFPYQSRANESQWNPASVLRTKELHCLWYSMIMHSFLSELGIDHQGVNAEGHSAISINIWKKNYIADVGLASILPYTLGKKNGVHKNMIVWDNKKTLYAADFWNPEQILLSQFYGNKWTVFYRLWKPKEAIFCYDKSIEFDPKCIDNYNNKWVALRHLWKKELWNIHVYIYASMKQWNQSVLWELLQMKQKILMPKEQKRIIDDFLANENYEWLRLYMLDLCKKEGV